MTRACEIEAENQGEVWQVLPNSIYKYFIFSYFCELSSLIHLYSHQPSTEIMTSSIYDRIRNNHIFQKFLRAFQFLSSVISLGLFSARLAKAGRLAYAAQRSNGAVEGILAAAVGMYTEPATVVQMNVPLTRYQHTPLLPYYFDCV